jgi:hypothetical protein
LKKGIEILFRELGKVDAIWFLTIPREKLVESVKRHSNWQQNLNKDLFFNEIFSDRKQDLLENLIFGRRTLFILL